MTAPISPVLLPKPDVYNKNLATCWDTLQGSRRIAVYRCLIDATGSLKSAIYLSQLMYWLSKSTDIIMKRDGWIFKSIAEMEQETGLTKREQGLCKVKLMELGVIETARKGFGAHLALRVNLCEVSRIITQVNNNDQSIEQISSISHHDLLSELKMENGLFYRRYLSKRISYHRDLVSLTGCIYCAVMLSFMFRQSLLHQSDSRRYLFASYTIEQWQKHLELPYKTQLTARNKMKALGLIHEKHYKNSRRIYTLINGEKLYSILCQLKSNQSQQKGKSRSNKQEHSISTKGKIKKLQMGKLQTGIFSQDKRENQEVTNGNIEHINGNINQHVNAIKVEEKDAHSEQNISRSNKWGSYKRESYKWGSQEVTNGNILIGIDYKEFTNVNNYNNTRTIPDEKSKIVDKPADVVVVENDFYKQLIYPVRFNDELKSASMKIFKQHLPNANLDILQSILDEVAGQHKPVSSPLGLLVTFCKLAAQNQLICIFAPSVQKNRNRVLQNTLEEEQQEKIRTRKPTEEEWEYGRLRSRELFERMQQKAKNRAKNRKQ